ncbi:hypothetical protein K8R78_04385 [bacterium]|nr:hypothetical protein [bacterium]
MPKLLPLPLLLILSLLLLAGCDGEAEEVEEGEALADPTGLSVEERAAHDALLDATDAFARELTLLHKTETFSCFVDVPEDELEGFWQKLDSFELEIGSFNVLDVEEYEAGEPPTAVVVVSAELVRNGVAEEPAEYRLHWSDSPEGWKLTELPFTAE